MNADPACLAQALGNGFRVVEVGGDLFAVRLACPELYVWKLFPGSDAHAVRGERCDCPQFERAQRCRHLEAARMCLRR